MTMCPGCNGAIAADNGVCIVCTVIVRIYRIKLGDGGERFGVAFHQGKKESGMSELVEFDQLRALTRDYVALDWPKIEAALDDADEWQTSLVLSQETRDLMFDPD